MLRLIRFLVATVLFISLAFCALDRAGLENAATGSGYSGAESGTGGNPGASSGGGSGSGAASGAGSGSGTELEDFCDDDPEALALCFTFEPHGNTTLLTDESTHGYDATLTHATYVAGRRGKALKFGTGATAIVPEPASPSALDILNKITVELWARPTTLPVSGRMTLVEKELQYKLYVRPNGDVHCAIGVGGEAIAAAALHVNEWTHIVCTHDVNKTALYINETRADLRTAKFTVSVDVNRGLAIGSNAPSGNHFDGLIDDLRIFRDVRTP